MGKRTFRPRDLLNKKVAGICGVARLTDKARAAHAGEIGSYKYGADSEQDTAILAFLGISAEAFQEAAVQVDNDVKLGVWILDNCERSPEEISEFNRKLKSWRQSRMPQDEFSKRRRELTKGIGASEEISASLDSVFFGHSSLIWLLEKCWTWLSKKWSKR
ncbi:hypothetical protein C6503_21430 [Candidatus Poribacteria bacterium]|nr:MAG: hypothetical protein C6503_21430 [Candidatus Poribacteria bacterium]